MDRIIYNGRALQRSPTCRSIKTIHRPNLVQLAGTPERMSLDYVSLLAFTPLHLQLLKPIQTFHSLLVHALTTLIQLQVNHLNVAAKVMLHDLYDRRAQLDVTFRPGLIVQHRNAHMCHLKHSTLPQTIRLHPPQYDPVVRCDYHCFLSAWSVTSFSSGDSTSCRLSRALSASKLFRRLTSGTSMPQYLPRHLKMSPNCSHVLGTDPETPCQPPPA